MSAKTKAIDLLSKSLSEWDAPNQYKLVMGLLDHALGNENVTNTVKKRVLKDIKAERWDPITDIYAGESGLATDPYSKYQRSLEMGYRPETYYHGTARKADSPTLLPGYAGMLLKHHKGWGASAPDPDNVLSRDLGIHMADDIGMSRNFSQDDLGKIYNLRARGNIEDIPDTDKGIWNPESREFYIPYQSEFDDSEVAKQAVKSFQRENPDAIDYERLYREINKDPETNYLQRFHNNGRPANSGATIYGSSIQQYKRDLNDRGTGILRYFNTFPDELTGTKSPYAYIAVNPGQLRTTDALFDPRLSDLPGLKYAEGGQVNARY